MEEKVQLTNMNIFVISSDPKECAQALDDLRLNKMIIETAQLLSTAMRFHGYTGNLVYKTAHLNHPCAVWARESNSNYEWLLSYMQELVIERKARTPKHHKTYDKLFALSQGIAFIPKGSQTPWPNCTPNKHIADIHDAYKITMRDKWAQDKRPPKWTLSQKPSWA
jgi:hypothetical protein